MGYGNLFVVAAPSGTGKTTLVKALVTELPGVAVSISHTTRSQRPGEESGRHYFFIQEDEFRRMIEQGAFLEYATVFGAFYGTSLRWVENTLQAGIDVILEIDWQGMQQIKTLVPDSISIFILPPSLANLKDRLIKRNRDKPQIIEERLADVQETVSHMNEFDFVIINDEFSHALNDLKLVVQANRLRQPQQAHKYAQLIGELSGS
jgi:guanylate kinase